MASSARAIRCELRSQKPGLTRREPAVPVPVPVQVPVTKAKPAESDGAKIVLQPRLCNLRSYGSDRVGVIRTRRDGEDGGRGVSPFFATLSEYIESSRKSHDFEIISGRLAMVSFRSLLRKDKFYMMDAYRWIRRPLHGQLNPRKALIIE
jgi:hypothetical protein